MFLIEYKDGEFIDGDDIQWIKVAKGKVSFVVKSQSKDLFYVDEKHQSTFVNNLEAINSNINSVESKYHKLNKEA